MTGSGVRALATGMSFVAFIGAAALLAGSQEALASPEPNVWGQDPFGTPPGAADESGGGDTEPRAPAELQGIIAGPGGVVAIIDYRIVRIGDRVGAEYVEEITPHAVVLRRGSHVRRLVMTVLPTHGR